MKKILTVPSLLKNETVYVTGNHHVSLPHIDEQGRILAVNLIRMDTNSLIEFFGEPLFSPLFKINGESAAFQFLEYAHDFIPSFCAELESASLHYEIFAPEGYHGFVMQIEVKAKQPIEVEFELQVNHTQATRTIFRQYPLNVTPVFFENQWTQCQVIEYVGHSGIAAISYHNSNQKVLHLESQESQCYTVYFGVGAEADGATLHNMDMQRRGSETLYKEMTAHLDQRHVELSDASLSKIVNLNMNYCYYFSLAKTIDTDQWTAITSRSHRYYVSSAFWARDVYLWAFPAIVMANPLQARELLELGMTRYLKNLPYHALYINGNVLYPGFELDEAVAVLVAVKKYISMTKDNTVTETEWFTTGTDYILKGLASWFNPALGLYRTELDPSDDPVSHNYLTHDNTLVWHVFEFLNELGYDCQAKELKQAIFDHLVMEHQGKKIFAYSIDESGHQLVYDNPPGSLMALPYYGLINSQDELYLNTVNYYWSKENEYYYEGSCFGQGGEHAQHPWPMSLCNRLLGAGFQKELIDCLKRMHFDNGIACETVDQDTGLALTGAAFATFAGYLAYALASCNHE